MPLESNDVQLIPLRVLPIVFVIDTSGSMVGRPISTLNYALDSTIEMLKQLNAEDFNIDIQIAVLSFNTKVEWATNGFISVSDGYVNAIEAQGLSDMGRALDELNRALSRRGLITWQLPPYKPILLFITDGYSAFDWREPLSKILLNRWFEHSKKIAIALGDDPDIEMLTQIVGNREAVLSLQDVNTLGCFIPDLCIYIARTCGVPGYDEGSSIIIKYKEDKGI